MTNKYMNLTEITDGDRKAIVIRSVGTEDRTFGVKFFESNQSVGIEWYDNKSESYAENAAENWVVGIKETPTF